MTRTGPPAAPTAALSTAPRLDAKMTRFVARARTAVASALPAGLDRTLPGRSSASVNGTARTLMPSTTPTPVRTTPRPRPPSRPSWPPRAHPPRRRQPARPTATTAQTRRNDRDRRMLSALLLTARQALRSRSASRSSMPSGGHRARQDPGPAPASRSCPASFTGDGHVGAGGSRSGRGITPPARIPASTLEMAVVNADTRQLLGSLAAIEPQDRSRRSRTLARSSASGQDETDGSGPTRSRKR
jgi:hypothetical protein